MEDTQMSRATASYTARLDRTLRKLQDRVKEQEAVLEKLRASTTSIDTVPSDDPTSHLQQLRALKATYETLTPTDPYLPSPESPIPGLLALRNTDKCIKETRDCISQTEVELQEIQKRLEKEQADLKDAKLVQAGLQTRISSLKGQIEERAQKPPRQVAKAMILEMEKKKAYYDAETKKLIRAFNGFIDGHLAAMLAAEELGGPIVGEMVDVDQSMLEAGFSTQGKARKVKGSVNEDKRQRRIDQIWGTRPLQDAQPQEPWNEQRAAAAEMRELTEQLLNSLVEAGEGGSGSYVELARESAAARFLVRSKVAQFHPRDARKLRLIDFGHELDD
ncbi:hypothetical protein M430DRAFT_26000 [Amorphotheca resinae ATCC 22711]|uniref:Uncharacterized protein n=1 Tax=Amorphotheca resinae ATCC 22711 TaxID=857342 RepID=A0A2T3B893_AMORE|nr:hypothetical protein M430DRAFT_26000 [Amorphotheca resinae ATCC 22711]PSS23061.1 hypothetical protein M430DRAFT_26000 [Amorphotheca resinae ATCC 22711]